MDAGTTMVQVGRRSVTLHRMGPLVPMVLIALTLALSAACWADAGAAGPAAPETGSAVRSEAPDAAKPDASASESNVKPVSPNADTVRARVQRPPARRSVAQGIDESVGRLTRGLDLDPQQQAKLREILLDEYRQLRKLRSENTGAGADRVGPMRAVLDQTKAKIRAMLNEEQKQKYSTDVPREMTAPTQADLQHWMQLQETQRRKDNDQSK